MLSYLRPRAEATCPIGSFRATEPSDTTRGFTGSATPLLVTYASAAIGLTAIIRRIHEERASENVRKGYRCLLRPCPSLDANHLHQLRPKTAAKVSTARRAYHYPLPEPFPCGSKHVTESVPVFRRAATANAEESVRSCADSTNGFSQD